MKKLIPGGLALALLSGCATGGGGYGAQWEPVVDVRPHQQAQYPTDLAECQAHAHKVMNAAEGAVAGAIGGAIFGALFGAAVGHNQGDFVRTGALVGGVGAAAEAEGGQRGIISRCLAGRGYSVLN